MPRRKRSCRYTFTSGDPCARESGHGGKHRSSAQLEQAREHARAKRAQTRQVEEDQHATEEAARRSRIEAKEEADRAGELAVKAAAETIQQRDQERRQREAERLIPTKLTEDELFAIGNAALITKYGIERASELRYGRVGGQEIDLQRAGIRIPKGGPFAAKNFWAQSERNARRWDAYQARERQAMVALAEGRPDEARRIKEANDARNRSELNWRRMAILEAKAKIARETLSQHQANRCDHEWTPGRSACRWCGEPRPAQGRRTRVAGHRRRAR